MSSYVVSEGRGPAWKQSWAERTLSSMGPPPLPLLAVFAIVVFYLYLSDSYERAFFVFKLFFFFLLPLIIVFLLRREPEDARSSFPTPLLSQERGAGTGKIAMLLLLVLLLISYHPSLKSKWSVSS